MTTPVTTFVYASHASAHLTRVQLLQILVYARDHNERAGITGLLMCRKGSFMQLLEGPEAAVRDMAARIERDTRHHGFRVLLEEVGVKRRFSEWSMAFEDVDAMDIVLHPGASAALQGEPLPIRDPDDHVLRLLEGFRTGGISGEVG